MDDSHQWLLIINDKDILLQKSQNHHLGNTIAHTSHLISTYMINSFQLSRHNRIRTNINTLSTPSLWAYRNINARMINEILQIIFGIALGCSLHL